MKTERKNDARAAMHAPEKHPNAVLGRLRKIQVPEEHLPIKRVAFGPERRAEETSIRPVTRSHETLQMVARNQLVKNSGPREVYVVAAHAHHLLFVRHRVCRKRHQDGFAAEKERADQLSLRSHHLHAPGVTRELRHRDQIVIVYELDRFQRQIANHLRLLTGLDVQILYVLQSLLPIVAETQV